MEVKHVARKRFASRRPPEQQRNLSIRLRVLRKVVVKSYRVHFVVAEIFAHRARRVGSDVLQRSRLCRGGGHHDRVLHRASIGQRLHDLRNRRPLLSNRTVNANHAAALLVDDRVQDDGGFSRLAVADDELALPAADRNHRVDRFNSCLQRLAHRLPVQNARRNFLQRIALLRGNRPFVVHRHPQRIHYAPNQRLADRHGHDRVCPLDRIAFFDRRIFAEQHRADLVLFEVQRDTEHLMRKREHLARHHFFQSVNTRNAVADADDRAHFLDRYGLFVVRDLFAKYFADFVCLDVCHACSVTQTRTVPPKQPAQKLAKLLRRQRRPHLIQSMPQRSVVNRVANSHNDAAQKPFVHRIFRFNFLACFLFE